MEYNLLEIKKRAVEYLEKTKKSVNLIKIREDLFDIANLTEIKDGQSYNNILGTLEKIEEYIHMTEIFELKTEDYQELKMLAEELRNQRIRNDDKVIDEIFEVIDKKDNKYDFLTRKSAEQYINNKKEDFEKEYKINVVTNNNIELKVLLNLIERNF